MATVANQNDCGNPISMGIGQLGFNNVIFKRKFRWTFEISGFCNDPNRVVPKNFVKVASRPNLSIEETEINYLNAKKWIPGKGSWETITVTYYDVATDLNRELYNWLATVYDYTDPVNLRQASQSRDYAGKATLVLYDGCGSPLERWVLGDVWPQAINFGELDYSSSEECTIELTLRYSEVAFESCCPKFVPKGCCSPCGSGTFGKSSAASKVQTIAFGI